ncbi:hypothetical protein CCACVL1_23364 [Corchorus capsularis]|uniref:CTLH domain-containing protein n=1 Tax=Corchorus capsularis TaxID=210143 RepID=A0A1R3GU47_COCAP|nr:hypothetical protein CCACVL1_23364 [Corchorus capsularis]
MAAEKKSALNKELLFLILQFCNDEGYKRTAHMLERESGCYFDMEFFGDMVLNGKWKKVDKYLSGFTKVDDNKYSTKIYFEIRKQYFLETLDNNDRAKALDILMKHLKVFAQDHEELFREMTLLLTLDNIRENESLRYYGNAESTRKTLWYELKKIIDANPILRGKLEFPSIKSQRLRRLINQGLNWQHIQCKYPQPNPDITTLFEDHVCQWQENQLFMQSNKNTQPTQDASVPVFPSSSISGPSTVTHGDEDTHFRGPITLGTATTLNLIGEPHTESQKSLLRTEDEVTSTVMHPGQSHSPASSISDELAVISINNDMLENIEPTSYSDLPKTVALVLNEVSSPVSMDFHPVQQTFLLVGTDVGGIGLWDVNSGQKLVSRNFVVWNIKACSMIFKTAMMKDPHVSVNRVAWSPDGSFFGVAYSKHIVQLYSFDVGIKIQQIVEIDAHVGGVNDLVFSRPRKQLLIITGGDDKLVKVVFFNYLPMSDSLACTTMAYGADNRRLFSCGTNKSGESFLVEWDESEGITKRTYQGLSKNSSGVVHFGPMKGKFLAAADDHVIKIWDMDNVELLTTIDAGGLPANPHIRLNEEGTLLAVIANENKIKILATYCGLRLLKASVHGFVDSSSDVSDSLRQVNILVVSQLLLVEDLSFLILFIFQINRPSQCQSLQLSGHRKGDKISRLIYTNAGNAILALASNASHFLWKWAQNDLNLSGKATSNVPPQLWQPRSCSRPMTNDLTGSKLEEAVPCLALSKNDSYLLSASGGKISLFNMLTFKTMMSFMPPSPAATCLAFHPQDNNIIAIGMDDSIILIYNVRLTKIISRLKGHSGTVTGLAFSTTLNVLVSSGVDSQIFTWSLDGWVTCSKFLEYPDNEGMPVVGSNTQVQFHQDQVHFLVTCETQLSIHEAKRLACVKQWIPENDTRISQATFSCDSQMVYACFRDGTISIFGASDLEIRCQIIPTAYLPTDASLNVHPNVHPIAMAAHPQKSTQFAVGLTDGGVIVFEPLAPGNTWYEGENEPATTSSTSSLEDD